MRYDLGIMPRTKYAVRTFPEGPFPEAIIALRQAAGLTQETAARVLEVTMSSVSKWERGVATPQPMVQEAVVARLRAAGKPLKLVRKPRPA